MTESTPSAPARSALAAKKGCVPGIFVAACFYAALSSCLWEFGFTGKMITALPCVLAGLLIAKILHKSQRVIVVMTLVYGLLIGLTTLGILYATCSLLFGGTKEWMRI